MNLVLIGYRATGKTTLARLLADRQENRHSQSEHDTENTRLSWHKLLQLSITE